VLAARFLVGQVRVRDESEPVLDGPGQVLVENLVSTVCGSDVHVLLHGHPDEAGSGPGFPGHESVGRVVGSTDPGFHEGDLVLAVPDLAHAGGFALRQVLPPNFLVPLPTAADIEQVVLAQQLGTVVFAMKRFWPRTLPVPDGATALVLGAGPVGLMFTRLLKLAGFAEVVVSDPHRHRLDAAVRMGATVTVEAEGDRVVEVMQARRDAGAAFVVEAAGTDTTRVQAIRCVALDGRIGMFGMPSSPEMTLPFELLFRRRATLELCWGAQAEPGLTSFREALELILSGQVDTEPLALRLAPVSELAQVLARSAAGGPDVIKSGIDFR